MGGAVWGSVGGDWSWASCWGGAWGPRFGGRLPGWGLQERAGAGTTLGLRGWGCQPGGGRLLRQGVRVFRPCWLLGGGGTPL